MNDNYPGLAGRAEGDEGCDPRGRSWWKSSFSMSNGDCIEVAVLANAHVGVPDSKAAAGPQLRFRPSVWTAFLADVNVGLGVRVSNFDDLGDA